MPPLWSVCTDSDGQGDTRDPASLGVLYHPAEPAICFLAGGFVAQLTSFISMILNFLN